MIKQLQDAVELLEDSQLCSWAAKKKHGLLRVLLVYGELALRGSLNSDFVRQVPWTPRVENRDLARREAF